MFKLRNFTISWRSQKQKSVSTSTTEAKYLALSQASKHFVWLTTALTDLQFPEILIALFGDNRFDIHIVEYHRISEVSEDIDIPHHCVCEIVYKKSVPLISIMMTNT
jgi:hypothetical protein